MLPSKVLEESVSLLLVRAVAGGGVRGKAEEKRRGGVEVRGEGSER